MHTLFRERYDIHWREKSFSETPYSDTSYSETPYSETQYSETSYSETPYSETPYSGWSTSDHEIEIMNLKMEIQRLENELGSKTASFEEKFREQQYLMTEQELKIIKAEEENDRITRKVTFLENHNKQVSDSHAYLKKESLKLQGENKELTSKLSWLMNGNDTTGEASDSCGLPEKLAPEKHGSEVKDQSIFNASLVFACSKLLQTEQPNGTTESAQQSSLTAVALWDFQGEHNDDLSFTEGERITIIEKIDTEWWRGSTDSAVGIFPASYVQLSSD